MSEWALSNFELTRKLRELEEKLGKLEARLQILEKPKPAVRRRRHG